MGCQEGGDKVSTSWISTHKTKEQYVEVQESSRQRWQVECFLLTPMTKMNPKKVEQILTDRYLPDSAPHPTQQLMNIHGS